jgi:hypothetical protein
MLNIFWEISSTVNMLKRVALIIFHALLIADLLEHLLQKEATLPY